jgi:hypothetical protein
MFNENNPLKDGICHCGKMCDGGGSGYRGREGENTTTLCRQITIAPFQTGKVIITGAKSQEQLDEALTFITGVFRNHFGNLCAGFNKTTRDSNKDKIHRSANKRILFINKDAIKYTGPTPENIPEDI